MDTLIYQRQEKGCGFACVKMALAKQSHRKEYRHLEEPKIYGVAPSLREIIQYASAHGLILKAYRLSNPKKIVDFLKEPVLAMIQEDGLTHMVYLRKKRGKTFFLYDPSKGKRRCKEKEFFSSFTGIFLKKEHYEEKEDSFQKPIFLPRRTIFLLDLLKSFSVLLVFLGFYFVDEQGSFPITVGLLGGFAILTVLSRSLLSKKMRQFDEKYLDSLLLIEPRKRKEAYLHFHRFKAAICSREPNLFAGALEIAALLVLFSLNELWMGMAMLFIFLLLLLERGLLYPKLAKKEEELSRAEEDFLSDSRTPGHEKVDAAKLSSLTYSLADRFCYRDYLLLAIEAFLALAVSFLSSSSTSLNGFFVWLMGLYLFGEESGKFLSCFFGKEDFRKEEAYFLGHFAPKG